MIQSVQKGMKWRLPRDQFWVSSAGRGASSGFDEGKGVVMERSDEFSDLAVAVA